MLRPTRATLVVGLGLASVLSLTQPSFGQTRDTGVRPAANPPAGNPSTPAAPPVARSISIGSIDVDRVLKDYDKFKVANETIRAESLERYNQLMKLANEGKAEQEKHGRFAPGSPDQKRCEDRITQLKAQIEALRENSEREFTQKEAETMATIYNEVATMAKSVAKQRGMTFVVKYSDAPANGSEPNSVVAAMSRTILYSDPSVDITGDVVKYLNYYYKQSGGPAPKTTTTTMPGQPAPPASGQPASPATRPAGPGGN
jgi:Skp family chaperone for outer membrane proteins